MQISNPIETEMITKYCHHRKLDVMDHQGNILRKEMKNESDFNILTKIAGARYITEIRNASRTQPNIQ